MISRKSILKKSSTPDNNTELYDEPIDLSSDDEEIRLFPAKDSIEILNKRSKSFLKVSKSRGDDQFDNKVKESHTAGRKQHGGNREDRGESVHVKYYDTDWVIVLYYTDHSLLQYSYTGLFVILLQN
jgi:hypothetical protein